MHHHLHTPLAPKYFMLIDVAHLQLYIVLKYTKLLFEFMQKLTLCSFAEFHACQWAVAGPAIKTTTQL